MDVNEDFSELLRQGFQIYDLPNKQILDESKNHLASHLRHLTGLQLDDTGILNSIHEHIEMLNDETANEIVLGMIKCFKDRYEMDQLVYDLCSSYIDKLLGPDIASQRNPNIVFQYPGSGRYSELHTDTPGNSPFELVAWVPLVDCYESKSFYVVPIQHTIKLLCDYKASKYADWSSFKKDVLKEAHHLTIKYGQVLFFWSGLLHGSLVNVSNESRFSYNVRYKSLFAPHGKKDPLSFYRVLKTSPLTKLALHSVD